MRSIAVLLLMLMCAPASAQEWIQYASKADLFGVNFPSEPKVADISYATEFGITLPGHVYTAEQGQGRYSVTVADYADSEKIHTARAVECRAKGGQGDACQNDWRGDVRGSIVFAAAYRAATNARARRNTEVAIVASGFSRTFKEPDHADQMSDACGRMRALRRGAGSRASLTRQLRPHRLDDDERRGQGTAFARPALVDLPGRQG